MAGSSDASLAGPGPHTPASFSPRGPGGLWVTGGRKAEPPAPQPRGTGGLPARHVPGPALLAARPLL